MLLRNLFENLSRTGKGKSAVIGWGRGMGHKGHMFLASSVITQAKETNSDPYFVVSRTVGKDDPITPEEKLTIYKKVFPQSGHIFQTATEEMPDLTRVLTKLNQMGYTDATVVVGADQVNALGYVKNYNGKPDKSGNIPFTFNTLNVISRQETNDPSRDQEGPRATPMRAVLMDPTKSEEEKFEVWRDAMNSELSDEEVMDLMHKAEQRMRAMVKPKKKGVAEGEQDPQSELKLINQKLKDAYKHVRNNSSVSIGWYMSQVKELKARREELIKQLKQGVAEGNEWQGNRGNSQAGITDHTFDEAKQYIKGNYPFHKTYNVSRVEPGMRYHANPEKVANKTQSLVKGIDSALDYLQVKQNPMMSGSTQVTPSIGYSWHTHESRANGIAVLYYEDRGMGNDTITIAAKDRNNLKGAVQVCRDAGVIPLPKVKKQGVAEGVDIGQEWMSDTELDQYVPQQLQQQWRELLGYDRNGNPSALWSNLTGGYEPDVNDPQHRALMVKVANKWFAAKKIPNVKFFNVKDADDELEWLVQIGEQGVAEGLNEFAMSGGDDGEDPFDNYPCYDCGSTIFLHHTKLCDLAEPNAKHDLPARPGSQHWTGEIPKGLNPIPGLQEGEANYDSAWDEKVKRLGQMAKEGPRKTVWDPVKRVYKTVPVNPPKDQPAKEAILPKSAFAGTPKNKLGPSAHLKGSMKRPTRAGDLVGGDAAESIEQETKDGGSYAVNKPGYSGEANYTAQPNWRGHNIGEDVETAMADAIARLIESQLK